MPCFMDSMFSEKAWCVSVIYIYIYIYIYAHAHTHTHIYTKMFSKKINLQLVYC